MERMLVTKIVLNQAGNVELYARGHKFRDTLLFDPSEGPDRVLKAFAFFRPADKEDVQFPVLVLRQRPSLWSEPFDVHTVRDDIVVARKVPLREAGRHGRPVSVWRQSGVLDSRVCPRVRSMVRRAMLRILRDLWRGSVCPLDAPRRFTKPRSSALP